jgi:signal transduction histidine kinase
MARLERLRDLAVRPHLPQRTVRLRLTTLYCALFFPLGVAIVIITFFVTYLSLHPDALHPVIERHGHGKTIVVPSGGVGPTGTPLYDVHIGSLELHLHEFVFGSCITLAVMVIVSVLLGWFLAGRVLRPLRTITDTTRSISENDLGQRLSLSGPRDELTELGDTIDGLLARLERAFDSQRRFVANASHELRTPLTVDRTMIQVALANPDLTLDSLRAVCVELLDTGREQERLIEALLILARSQRGLDQWESVDLAAVTREVLLARESYAAEREILVDGSLSDVTVPGDARLLIQLVSNLVDNALRHNIDGGSVKVTLVVDGSEAALAVSNTGTLVEPDQVSRLLQPFQRGTPDRTTNPNGLGLGLSIIADIALAHGARLDVLSRIQGGLTVTVNFPLTSIAGSGGSPDRVKPIDG